MKKRIILISIIGIFLLMLPLMAEADIVANGTCGDNLTWTLGDDNVLTISGSGKMTAKPWNSYRSSVCSIIIEEGVTSICNAAFIEFNVLTSVSIPNSVTLIGNSAFCDCWSLLSISIPAGVKTIEQAAFSGCDLLSSVSFSEGLETIGDEAFSYCYKRKRQTWDV